MCLPISLTIEAGTVFHSRTRKGEVLVADDDHVASLYHLTEQICAEAGLSAYEISNYAADGAASRHNLCYWRSGNWLAVGPGGHGQFWAQDGRYHLVNRRSPSGWLSDSLSQSHGCEQISVLTAREIFDNYWMMGLRMTEPRPLSHQHVSSKFRLDEAWLDNFCEAGWLVKKKQTHSQQRWKAGCGLTICLANCLARDLPARHQKCDIIDNLCYCGHPAVG